MRYDIFLSFSRGKGDENAASVAECKRVLRIVKNQMKLHTFVDFDEMEAGRDWIEQCRAILTNDFKPTVVLLATTRAAGSEAVRKEIEFARSKGLDIVPIEYDEGASAALLGNERLHYLRPESDDVALERQLRIALTRRIVEFLDEQQLLAKEWCDRVQPPGRPSFWSERWREVLWPGDSPRSVAVTARGGSGKSFLIAHLVRDLLDKADWYPVIVRPELLQTAGVERLVTALGAMALENLPEHLERLAADRALRVVFIVDGLDRAPARANEIALWLNGLIGAAPVVIGCRDGVWTERFRGAVSIDVHHLRPLDMTFVRVALRDHAPRLLGYETDLLTIPFFLDHVLRSSKTWPDIPPNETDFLARTWRVAVVEREIVPKGSGRPFLLETLARLQLGELRYDVPRSKLLSAVGGTEDAEETLRALADEGLLFETPAPGSSDGPTVRLHHDLVDNYSMSRLLVAAAGERHKLYRRIAVGCAWSVVSGLIRYASDRGMNELVDEAFNHMLFVLDQKSTQEDHWLDQAWAVTYVLKECFVPLMPRILDCLEACATGAPVEPVRDQRVSRRSPKPPRLTQVTASTLISAFRVLDRGTVEQGEAAVPVLAAILANDDWYHARAVEALAKFESRDAVLAIVRFGEERLRCQDDLESLEYVALGLKGRTEPQAEALLRAIYDDPGVRKSRPRAVRLAAVVLNEERPGCVNVPDPTEDEVIAGLRITTTHRGKTTYTDWAVVQEYAEMVSAIVSRGANPFSPDVLAALIGALDHVQIFVRSPVAECLGWFDERKARDALLDELLEPEVPAEVLSSCVGALKRQTERQPAAADRQLRRVLALRAAMVAEARQQVSISSALRRSMVDPGGRRHDDWLLDAGCAEVVSPGDGSVSGACRFTVVSEDEAPLTPPFDAVVKDEHRAAAGAAFEQKYRFTDLRRDADGALLVTLAPTTWELGRGFHTVARSSPEQLTGRGGAGWPQPIPLGDDRLPGIAVVHVVVLTSDGRLLLAQRSRNVGYAPGHWSASFEEQITRSDIDAGGDAVTNAARRGFGEEFGDDLDPGRSFSLTAILEIPILNAAVVTLFECPHTAVQIADRWAREPRPTHHFEADTVSSVELSGASLYDLVSGAGPHSPLHPTSSMRVALARRFLQQR